MSKASRRLAGLLALAAIVLSAVVAGPALAAPAKWDPQTTNVPYLAWRGEQVRLVKCDPLLATEGVKVEFFVEEWSGTGLVPRVEEATVDASSGCARADVVSLDPGLARVKLVATDPSGQPILKHQFLVIWMSLTDPAIDEVGASDPTGDRTLGDPAGDGNFNAGGNDGRIQVIVKGTFPYGGTTYTLPDAWSTLAGLLAQDSDSDPFNNAAKWDIHDDLLKTENHPLGSQCTTHLASVSIDAVDNCNGATGDAGPFSRVFGDVIPALGPFDPVRPELTLFSDGKLDSGDAPMPAARVDVSIAPNSGAPTDISGVGSLERSDKTDVYSRNGNGSFVAHNLYAPFYASWIPATSRPDLASGIDGPAAGNNFTGFLVNGIYDFWDPIALRTAVAAPTTCLRRSDQEPAYRQTPAGDQSVAVYTDEHGEAQVKYNPGGRGGNGFYFDNIPGVIFNDNGGCDLEGIDVIGTSSITATARYPYQPVSDPDHSSAPLTKKVHSLFTKTISYFPKGPGEANSNARIVVVHAQDIDGAPFANEKVCFFVGDKADGAFGFSGTTGLPGKRFSVGGTDGGTFGTADVCRITDPYGNAAIEVINSDPELINVTALFVGEALLRDIDVDFGVPTSTGGPTPPASPAKDPPPPVTVTDARKAGVPIGFATHKKAKAARVSVSYLKSRHGKRFVVIRVKSSKGKAKVRIRLMGKHGHTIKVVTRTIRTNKLVSIRVTTKVKKARVALAH
jgi:hypothetical protein